MTYDPSVGIDQIAGLNRFWNTMEIGGPILNRVGLDIPIYNKLLKLKLLEEGIEIDLMDFHYSEYNSLDEPTESHLAVWPNPATEMVYIEGSEFAEMRVYNALGQLVKTVRDSNEIDVSGLVEGVYLVRITDADGKNYVARVAVKK